MCWFSRVQQASRKLRAGVHRNMHGVWCMRGTGLSDRGTVISAIMPRCMAQKGSVSGACTGSCQAAALQCTQMHNSTRLSHIRRQLSCSAAAKYSSTDESTKNTRQQEGGVSLPTTGLGVLGMLGLFGKRVILVLGGKKAAFGIFSVVSLKKLLFLPAWLTVLSVSAGLSASYWASQTEAPITGRQRAMLVTASQEIKMGESAWHALLNGGCDLMSVNDAQVQRCVRVGEKVIHALHLLLPTEKRREWMFTVAKSSASQVEAYSIAPGFVLVSQGLMQMCTTDAQLAFVLAHEVAHVLARHSAEKQSRYALWGTLKHSLEQSLGISSEDQVLDLILHLPLSRELELEADEIALVLMSKACFNVDAAAHVFTKMQARNLEPLDWVKHWNTHPSFKARIARMQAKMLEVAKAYPCHHQDELRVALA